MREYLLVLPKYFLPKNRKQKAIPCQNCRGLINFFMKLISYLPKAALKRSMASKVFSRSPKAVRRK